jgi:hypothetical protein
MPDQINKVTVWLQLRDSISAQSSTVNAALLKIIGTADMMRQKFLAFSGVAGPLGALLGGAGIYSITSQAINHWPG